jgi:exonuclease SbcC
MITIESIRLRNFRAIREAFFVPKNEGITGIFGSNGAGKTTFLSGTLFALFGALPPNSTKASLRREHSGKEECSVSVVFTHMGQTIEVIREVSGNANTIRVYVYVDGIEQTHDSVGYADAWISQRLGVDLEGFLTAFVVRQKELDKLVTSTPGERKKIIERLAGVEAINDALGKARKDEKNAKDILSKIPGSEANVAEAESQVLFLTNEVESLTELKAELQEKMLEKQNTQKTLSAELETLRTQEANLFRATTRLESLLKENDSATRRLTELEYVKNVSNDYDVASLRAEHQNIVNEMSDINSKINAFRVKEAGLRQRLNDYENELLSFENRISSVDIDITNEESFVEDKKVAVASIDSLQDLRSSAVARRADLMTSIETLKHNTDCPTCHTHLEDPEALVKSLREMADMQSVSASKAEKDILSEREKISHIDTSLSKIRTITELITRREDTKIKVASVKTQQEQLEDISSLEARMTELAEKKDAVTELGIKASNLEKDKTAYAQADATLTNNEVAINELKRTIIEINKAFSPDKLLNTKNDLTRTQNELNILSNKVNESFSDLSAKESRLYVANNNYKSSTEQWKRKKELFEVQEKKALTTEFIDKFRKETVASLTPEISDYATSLISDITDGAYTEIRLAEDFQLSVVNANGDERNVGWLSGGEESAVAFALRLAIAFLITNSSSDFLWLDEPLTAQDQDRRTAMLTTIRNLPIKQIIMINHAQEAADIVDKAITVIPDIVHGSVLEDEEIDDLDSVPDE